MWIQDTFFSSPTSTGRPLPLAGGEAAGKDLGSAAWIQPPSQLPLSPRLDFPICEVELTIISISEGVS